MAQDRMAAYRAQRQTGPGQSSPGVSTAAGGVSHELSTFAARDGLDTMPSFLEEASSIQDDIKTFSGDVSRISTLNARVLDAIGDDAGPQSTVKAELDSLVNETRTRSGALKDRIKRLQDAVIPSSSDAGAQLKRQDKEMRQNRATFVRQKFVEALQAYQKVEQEHRARSRTRVERQIRIVKSDATQEEINQAIASGEGSQVFMQALTSNANYAHARSAYNEVQARAQDLRKMEQTLAELAQLFADMALLVEQQNETLLAIEEGAKQTEEHAEEGAKQVGISVEIARSLRKKRWICFFIVLIVIIILAVVLAVEFTKK
ncbi:t-SNARE [Mycena amicta]|nr:t-SNARE [Mycena amicta]